MDSNGGKKRLIPHSRPFLGEEEAAEAARVIRSGHVAQGEEVRRFEARVAEYLGVPHAVAVSSGTAALHLTLLAMGIGPGDEVILPSYVCTALLNAVGYVGATAVPADVRSRSGNIDPEDVRARITGSTRAVIAPHLFGRPVDLDALFDLGIPVIEDCAQSIGATYDGAPTGSFGTAAIFSFYATKVMTTGEGGLVATRSRKLADAVRGLRAYDKQEVYEIRYNCKMTDIQAAVGAVQLDRLPAMIQKRKRIAAEYFRRFSGLPAILPAESPGHIYYRYVLDLNGRDPRAFAARAKNRGVVCEPPVHLPIHRCLGLGGYPRTEAAWQNWVSIPLYPALSDDQIRQVVESVQKALLSDGSST